MRRSPNGCPLSQNGMGRQQKCIFIIYNKYINRGYCCPNRTRCDATNQFMQNQTNYRDSMKAKELHQLQAGFKPWPVFWSPLWFRCFQVWVVKDTSTSCCPEKSFENSEVLFAKKWKISKIEVCRMGPTLAVDQMALLVPFWGNNSPGLFGTDVHCPKVLTSLLKPSGPAPPSAEDNNCWAHWA